MNTYLFLSIIILLAVICCSDIRQRIIANKVILLLLAVTLPYAYLTFGQVFWLNALLTLVIGFALFSLRIIGAGDIKLLATLMFAVPPQQITAFLFFTSFFGFLLILFGWIFFRQNIKTHGLPYGVAISSGFLLTIWGLN